MNKKKVKILVSVASLVLVVAVMAVGVWAATQVSVASTVTVGFTAVGIEGNCKVYIGGSYDSSKAKYGNTSAADTASNGSALATAAPGTEIASWTLDTTQSSNVTSQAYINFDFIDADNDGDVANDETVTLTFVFNNTSTAHAFTVTPTATTSSTKFSVSAGPALTGQTAVAAEESGSITITFTALTNASFSGETASISFAIAKVAA